MNTSITRFLPLALLFVTLLTGCQNAHLPGRMSGRSMGAIHPGMAKAEVLKVMGLPFLAATFHGNDFTSLKLITLEVLRYQHIQSEGFYLVIFRDGKVEAYGPETGALAERIEGVFAPSPHQDADAESSNPP
jgi:outer membrane protein assembly factor BamE (lipoprotein component of BamABCDE complex)